ncbi:hypothetical protein [Bacillus nitroreducens]
MIELCSFLDKILVSLSNVTAGEHGLAKRNTHKREWNCYNEHNDDKQEGKKLSDKAKCR